MKVYAVMYEQPDWGDSLIDVFTSEELAEKWIKEKVRSYYQREYYVDEWEVREE